MEECEGHWTAAAGDGDTVLHSLSCHIMYYIMFVLRFVLFFTNSKNDCMEGGGASVRALLQLGLRIFFRNSTMR